MKVSFGTTIVQKNRRIAIDQNLLENLDLSEGDAVKLFLDTDTKVIVIQKNASKSSEHTAPVVRDNGQRNQP